MSSKIFIDVREPQEFARGHVEGAINVPPGDLMSGASQLKDIPKDSELVVYCLTGSRSNVSIGLLNGLGYNDVENGINKQHVESKYFS